MGFGFFIYNSSVSEVFQNERVVEIPLQKGIFKGIILRNHFFFEIFVQNKVILSRSEKGSSLALHIQ